MYHVIFKKGSKSFVYIASSHLNMPLCGAYIVYRWMSVVMVAVLYNSFLIIARETFVQLETLSITAWLLLDYAADTIYLIDMVVQFFTSKFPSYIILNYI